MGLILDSTIIISGERLGWTVAEFIKWTIQQHGDPDLAISVVTALELVHGIVRAESNQRRANRQRFLDDLLAGMPVQPVTVAIALRAGRIDGQLHAIGARIPLGDLLIGSTALELGYEVATANLRHFTAIPDLVVKQL